MLLLLLACQVPGAPPPALPPPSVQEAPATPVAFPLPTVAPPGIARPADDPATTALVVAIHGRGDRPEHFQALTRGWPEVAHVVVPAAPTPHGSGFSWFPLRAVADGPELAQGVAEAADRLAAWLADSPADPLVVTGFSQGGMLSFALAVRHPHLVDAVVPVGGMLPQGLWPTAVPPGAPPILALHGGADEVVPTAAAVATVEALAGLGWPAELRTWDGVGHEIPLPMRASLDAAVRAAATRDDDDAGEPP